MIRKPKFSLCALLLLCFTPIAAADIVSASSEHFHLKLEKSVDATPETVWTRLIRPSDWWSSEHTYSGDAQNLRLTAIAGGDWREIWSGGSVWHGTVLQSQPPKTLRMQAPFGPLQGITLNVVWTVKLTELETGTSVSFEIVAHGPPSSRLNSLAGPVDGVFAEALDNLTDLNASTGD